MPRLAAKLDIAQLSDITAVVDADTFERPIYAGNAIATVRSGDAVKAITVRTTGFDPAGKGGGNAVVEIVETAPDSGIAQFVSRGVTRLDRPELTSAQIIVSGGRGLGSGENYTKVLEPLADKLNAALGASRAAVDAGYVPNDYQVGQTGKIAKSGSEGSEKSMNKQERSLRALVRKWMGPQTSGQVRVTGFSHSRAKPWRYVCVETSRPAGNLAIVFFRHEDGSWCVFPPAIRRPAMRIAAPATSIDEWAFDGIQNVA